MSAKAKVRLSCKRGDREVPELVCGRLLPCPWHTAIIDLSPTPATVTVPVTATRGINPVMLGLLKQIARDIDPGTVRKMSRTNARSGTAE